MIRVLITFLILYFSIISVFAEASIDFSASKSEYNIEETIILDIEINSDLNGDLEIQIDNIEKFQVVWKRQSQSNKIINGVEATSFSLKLSLLALEAWNYKIWPIKAKQLEEEFISKILDVKISWERIMVNNNLKKNEDETTWEVTEENIDDINLNNQEDEIKIIPKEISWIDWKIMNDIYPQKDFLLWSLFLKTSLYLLFIAITLIILLNFLEKKYREYFKKQELLKQLNKKVIKKKINYNKLFKILEEKFLEEKKEIFYAKLSEVFRLYLDDKIKNWLSKKSFLEIKKFENIDKKLINIYEKIYFPEYNTKEDNIDERKELLEEIKYFMKKYIKNTKG